LAGGLARPWLQELVQVPDVVGLHDEEGRVLGERQPEPVDLDAVVALVEQRLRAALSVWAVLWRMRLLDVEEHLADLRLVMTRRATVDGARDRIGWLAAPGGGVAENLGATRL